MLERRAHACSYLHRFHRVFRQTVCNPGLSVAIIPGRYLRRFHRVFRQTVCDPSLSVALMPVLIFIGFTVFSAKLYVTHA